MPVNLTAGTPLQNGKYVLNHLLGQSALSVTLKATQTRLNQAVVLKTLRSQPQQDVAHLQQPFLEDVRRFSQCQHPGLVRVLDSFTEAGLPFAVMDYVAGQPLAEQVQLRDPLPEAQVVQYVRQAGSALSVMHRQGLLHRDIKPENLVRPKGATFVVLVDFRLGPDLELADPDRSESLLANPYAAIELHQPQAILTAATDIYALAATLYFLVTRHAPIAASRRHQLFLVPPRQLQPDLSPAIEHAILSGMALNAHDRPQTIAAWFALLPASDSLPAVQGANGGVTRGAIDLPDPSAYNPSTDNPSTYNGASRPTSPPAPAFTQSDPAVAPQVRLTPSHAPAPKSRLPKALGLTAAIALAGGLGLGLALRLSAINGIGPTFFQTQQDFPPIQNWPLQATSAEVFTPAPLPLQEPAPLRDDVPDRPRRSRVAPSPTPTPLVPTPSPTTTIEATPTPLATPDNPDFQPPPSPAPPTNLPPQPLPSAPSAPNSSGYPLRQERSPLEQPETNPARNSP